LVLFPSRSVLSRSAKIRPMTRCAITLAPVKRRVFQTAPWKLSLVRMST